MRGVAGFVDEQVGRDDRDHANRHVDEEDPVPVDVLGDDAADKRADGEREGRDASPDANRRAALFRRECDGNDREGCGIHHGRADTLNHTRGDQHRRARRQAAAERRQREDDETCDEDAATAEKVGEFAAGEHQRAERECVTGDNPLKRLDLQVQRLFDRRQRDVHDRVVEHDHEQSERDRPKRPPLALLVGNEMCLHRFAPSFPPSTGPGVEATSERYADRSRGLCSPSCVNGSR